MFGLRPVFGAERTVVAPDRTLLDAPIPHANQHTARICEAQRRDLPNAGPAPTYEPPRRVRRLTGVRPPPAA